MSWNWNEVSLGLTLLVMPISNAQQLHGGLMRTPYSAESRLCVVKSYAGPNRTPSVEQFVIGLCRHKLVEGGVDTRLGVRAGADVVVAECEI